MISQKESKQVSIDSWIQTTVKRHKKKKKQRSTNKRS